MIVCNGQPVTKEWVGGFYRRRMLCTFVAILVMLLLGIALLSVSVVGVNWVTGIDTIWSYFKCKEYMSCGGRAMNYSATAWHRVCYYGGIAGMTVGSALILTSVLVGSILTHYGAIKKIFGHEQDAVVENA